MADIPPRLADSLRDRYTVERELGRGGMATVYLARDLKHDRPVALKVLRPELAAALGPERFLREIRLTARLAHPHILPLLDSGQVDGFLYYAMPFVAGESLRQRLDREKQLPLDHALGIAREVADALDYAHRQGIVHRDVKPENILLEEGHGVVADFGIAQALAAAGGEKLTGTGLVVGTPAYLSPEQATPDRQLDGRSDLYNLGCVLYEMLAGEPPYGGPTAQAGALARGGAGCRIEGASGYRHQIDVSLRTEEWLVLIECKRWQKMIGVGVEEVLVLAARKLDIGEAHPGRKIWVGMVSRCAPSRNVPNLATHFGISIDTVSSATEYAIRLKEPLGIGQLERVKCSDWGEVIVSHPVEASQSPSP